MTPSLSPLDKVIRAIWIVGAITTMALIYAASRFPIAFPAGFTLAWVLMVMMFARRRTMFPAVNSYSSDMQDAFTFFGWFVLALIGAGAVTMWWFGGFPIPRNPG